MKFLCEARHCLTPHVWQGQRHVQSLTGVPVSRSSAEGPLQAEAASLAQSWSLAEKICTSTALTSTAHAPSQAQAQAASAWCTEHNQRRVCSARV